MRSVLITGCSRGGIGWDAALKLQSRGWRVFATARKESELEALAQAGVQTLPMELSDQESIKAGFEWVMAHTGGRLDALFHNAGYGQPGALEDLSSEAFVRQFETNLFGVHTLTRLALPVMRTQNGGRIVFHSSILGLVSLRFRGAYNASKYALEGYADTLRLELMDTPITISTLNTGPIVSRFRDNAYAAFKSEIEIQKSVHHEAYTLAVRRFESEQRSDRFTLSASAVTKRVIHALEHPRPKARYLITPPSVLLSTLKRLLPTRVLDGLLFRAI